MAALAIVALPVAALASHGKAGLWKITTTTHIAGMQMPKLSPQQMAQMKAMGVHIPMGNTMTMQHCVTESDAKADAPPAAQQPQSGCKTTNMKVVAHTMSADMVCNAKMKGEGHFTMTYDSPEHYTGQTNFKGTMEGRPADMSTTYEGTWISADCGNAHH